MAGRDARPWLQPEQEQERARWLLIAALAIEYPERVVHLLEAIPLYEELLKDYDETGLLIQKFHLRNSVKAQLESEEEFPGLPRIIGKPSKLSIALGQWAQCNGMMTAIGYRSEPPDYATKIYIYAPPFWIGKHGVRLLEAGAHDAISVVKACHDYAQYFKLDSRYTNEKRRPYPPHPDIFFVPIHESKREFLVKAHATLETYADEILAWYEEYGYMPAQEKLASDKHYRWLAWYLAEGLSPEEIANRDAERGFEALGYDAVSKQLLGPTGLAHLVGIVKESET